MYILDLECKQIFMTTRYNEHKMSVCKTILSARYTGMLDDGHWKIMDMRPPGGRRPRTRWMDAVDRENGGTGKQDGG